MKRAALVLLALAVAFAAVSRPVPQAPSKEEGLAAFATVQKVLQHPRCQNCHIPGDAPLQLDSGLPHQQNVLRGKDGRGAPGLACGTCHGASNAPDSWGPSMPPGTPNWHLPPADQKMVFIGLSAGDLCRTVQDPKKNGAKTFAELDHHVAEDKLVLWGWQPGVGRAPVPVPHEEFVASWRTWVAAGAPCPAK